MVNVLLSNAVDRGFESQFDKTKHPCKHEARRSKSKDWFARIRTEKQHYENPTRCWCNTNRTSSSHQKVATAGGAMFSMLASGVVDLDWSPGCGRS